jgi:GGDEF domain-containing protein/CHASE3 domain sensor protein
MHVPEYKSISARLTRWPFFRFTIAVKMLIGYLGLSVVVVLITGMTLLSLKRLNDITRDIILTEAPVIDISDKLVDTILSQELYGRRYSLIRSPEFLDLYNKKTVEFDSRLDDLKQLPGKKQFSAEKLKSLYDDYSVSFRKMFEYKGKPGLAHAIELDKDLREKQALLIDFIKSISHNAIMSQNKKSRLSAKAGEEAFGSIISLGVICIPVALITTLLITRNISGSIRKLKIATKKVAMGEFENLPQVKSHDELGELSLYFSEMARRLKQLEQILVDMSPLTRMPGNIAIENTLTKRIDDGKPLAFCHFDLDNFKVFGDKYGYARGSEVIKATAQIIETALSEFGTKHDFIGHIGGDDFVVITTPDRYEVICRAVIDAFDRKIPDFYSPEDREQRFILGKTRQGTEMAFPLMSISIGVVTNRERELKDPLQVGEIAAELKECAKLRRGSNIVVDKVAEETFR